MELDVGNIGSERINRKGSRCRWRWLMVKKEVSSVDRLLVGE